jgi:hypothetical protein
MNVNEMRRQLAQHYGPGSSFTKRLPGMPDAQVIAVYYRLKNKGELK